MKIYAKSTICLFFSILILLSSSMAFSAENSSIVPDLPKDLVIEKEYKPGLGRALGSVRLVQGRVVITHSDMAKGYMAETGTPLYKGDIIVTQDDARVRFGLRDGSVVTLASNTRIELSESVFEREKKSRFSFLKLGLGKARFMVTKLLNYRRSNFRVRTPTAVVGVRGSDFVVETTLTETEVTTFGDTLVEFINSDFPDQPRQVDSMKSCMTRIGIPPSMPRAISPQEAEDKKRDFLFPSDMEKTDDEIVKEIKDQEPYETAYDIYDMEREIFIPEDELVEPEGKRVSTEPDRDLGRIMKENEDISEIQELIEQTATEDAVEDLPEFPESPNQ